MNFPQYAAPARMSWARLLKRGEARVGLEAFFSHQRPPWAAAALPASSTH